MIQGVVESFYNELIEVAAGDSLEISKIYFATSNRGSIGRKIQCIRVPPARIHLIVALPHRKRPVRTEINPKLR